MCSLHEQPQIYSTLCSITKDSTNVLCIPFSTNVSLDLLQQTRNVLSNRELAENLHLNICLQRCIPLLIAEPAGPARNPGPPNSFLL